MRGTFRSMATRRPHPPMLHRRRCRSNVFTHPYGGAGLFHPYFYHGQMVDGVVAGVHRFPAYGGGDGRALAAGCYHTEGVAIKTAVGLLPICEQPSYYNLQDPCGEGSGQPPLEYPSSNEGWSIVPNPVQSVLTIGGPNGFSGGAVAEVFGIAGRSNLTAPFAGGMVKVDVSKLPDGIYFLKISTFGQTPIVKKFVKSTIDH